MCSGNLTVTLCFDYTLISINTYTCITTTVAALNRIQCQGVINQITTYYFYFSKKQLQSVSVCSKNVCNHVLKVIAHCYYLYICIQHFRYNINGYFNKI